MVASLYDALMENKNMTPSILRILNKEKDNSTYKTYSLLAKKFDDLISNLSNFENDNF